MIVLLERSLKKLVLTSKTIFVRMITLNFESMTSLLVCTSFQEFQKTQNLTQKLEEKFGTLSGSLLRNCLVIEMI
ncbi:DCP2 isoform 5 [Pongo abelii]|uniref:DCP2 isoform 5 n=1 Tax=Pongo abelii TaxID=9601 RepID=A0A2J8XEL9_PONAB|nr:DCP2 isoform 5 [Pongo abelii]